MAIEDELDVILNKKPASFKKLEETYSSSTILDLTDVDYFIPNIAVTKPDLCGISYLIIKSEQRGKEITEERYIKVRILCPGDEIELQKADFYEISSKYISLKLNTNYQLNLAVDFFHISKNNKVRGKLNWQIKLLLQNSKNLNEETNFDLTQNPSSIDYLSSIDPLEDFPGLKRYQFKAKFSIKIQQSYSYLIVLLKSTDSETVLHNNFKAWDLKTLNSDTDVALQTFSITNNRVTVGSPLPLSSGTVSSTNVNLDKVKVSLYWSLDNKLETGDYLVPLGITVSNSGSVTITGNVPSPPHQKYCGKIYSILKADGNDEIIEKDKTNNAKSILTTLICGSGDDLALQDFNVVSPSIFVKDRKTNIHFQALVSCTSADCSSKTESNNNFNVELLLSSNGKYRSSTTDLLTVSNLQAVTGKGRTSSLISEAAYVDLSADVTISSSLCNKERYYLMLKLTPSDTYLTNNYMVTPLKLKCYDTDSLDLQTNSLSINSVNFDSDNFFILDYSVETFGNFEIVQTDYSQYGLSLYLSLDTTYDDEDIRLFAELSKCNIKKLSDAVSSGSTKNIKITDKFRLPGETKLRQFCSQNYYIIAVIDSYHTFMETNERNNEITSSVQTQIPNLNCANFPFSKSCMCFFLIFYITRKFYNCFNIFSGYKNFRQGNI